LRIQIQGFLSNQGTWFLANNSLGNPESESRIPEWCRRRSSVVQGCALSASRWMCTFHPTDYCVPRHMPPVGSSGVAFSDEGCNHVGWEGTVGEGRHLIHAVLVANNIYSRNPSTKWLITNTARLAQMYSDFMSENLTQADRGYNTVQGDRGDFTQGYIPTGCGRLDQGQSLLERPSASNCARLNAHSQQRSRYKRAIENNALFACIYVNLARPDLCRPGVRHRTPGCRLSRPG